MPTTTTRGDVQPLHYRNDKGLIRFGRCPDRKGLQAGAVARTQRQRLERLELELAIAGHPQPGVAARQLIARGAAL